jgi:RNA polymerase sigma-70 factor, ECF subfamily
MIFMSASDHNHFLQLFVPNQRRLYSFLRAHVYSREDAEELMQQTSMLLWEKFPSFRVEEDFGRWACGMARGLLLNHLRKTKRVKSLLGEFANQAIVEDLIARSQSVDVERESLAECLKKLPPRGRRLIGLRYMDGTSVEDIADKMGQSPSSIYKTLERIRETLFDCIRERMAALEM